MEESKLLESRSLDAGLGFSGGSGKSFRQVKVPGSSERYLFKEYDLDKAGTPLNWSALDRVIAWARATTPEVRARCALPRDVVTRGGVPVGVLIPLADTRFYRTKNTGERVPQTGADLGRNMKSDPGLVWGSLGDLLSTTLRLHAQNVWVVDLQPNNFLFTSARPADISHPITLLLDCDGFAIHGETLIDIQPEDYYVMKPGGGVRCPPSKERDMHCFAMTAIRALMDDHGHQVVSAPPAEIEEALGAYSAMFARWLAMEPMLPEDVSRAVLLANVMRGCRGPLRDKVFQGGMARIAKQGAADAFVPPTSPQPSPATTCQPEAGQPPSQQMPGKLPSSAPTTSKGTLVGPVVAVAVVLLLLAVLLALIGTN